MNTRNALPALFLIVFLAFISCGKKGDPFLTVVEGEARVTGLEAGWDGESVHLTGRIQGTAGKGEGVRAYYAAYPQDQAPCEGCPVEYQGFKSFGPEVVEERRLSCKVTDTQAGNIYFFDVRIVGPGDSEGPPSDRVRVEVPELH